eukprot:scaffold56522_cov59-Attheya_sp.AAC.9
MSTSTNHWTKHFIGLHDRDGRSSDNQLLNMSEGSLTMTTTGASEEEEIENAPLNAAKIVGTVL